MKSRKILCLLLMSLLVFSGCKKENVEAPKEEVKEQTLDEKAEEIISKMTLEEKAAQLFVVLPESIVDGVSCVVAAGDTTKEAIDHTPVGGIIYLGENLQSEEQVKEMLSNVKKYSMDRIGVPPFLCVDEEGGIVSRLSNTGNFDVPKIENMIEIGKGQDPERAKEVGKTIGKYLNEFGFNVDFAPVADVYSNPENEIVRERSFGTDTELVSSMALKVMEGLQEEKVNAVYKHFPGHGATAGDTHEGYAYTDKTLEELRQCELIPFQKGIENQVPFIMVGHISLPQVIGDHTPASLSDTIITKLLREEMGYDGIVVTDAMNMGAVVQQYSSEEAAVKTLQAGADIILMPENFKEAYEGVIKAVENGELTEERIEESLTRILKVKLSME